MYKIGEFSILSKTTVKTLRYYEKEKLLIPAYIDKAAGEGTAEFISQAIYEYCSKKS